jgi:hypothetical protein
VKIILSRWNQENSSASGSDYSKIPTHSIGIVPAEKNRPLRNEFVKGQVEGFVRKTKFYGPTCSYQT